MRALLLVLTVSVAVKAQSGSADLFEKKIRPVLVAHCYACHSAKLKSPMSGLVLDTRAGLARGGASGPVVLPGKPGESRLLRALRYLDPKLQMPPAGKLPDRTIADFTDWIASGAVDPRVDSTESSPAARAIDFEKGRKWWAFQPVREITPPRVRAARWPRTRIDSFLLAGLEEKNLKPSPPADARTLVRRVWLDLAGFAPTYQEVEQFTRDTSAEAYEKLIDRLLASPHYGERWGRYWLDVARYAEDNQNNGPTNPYYPFAWRYRDWVIEAVNRDIPYNRFVMLQLAADQMPGVPRGDWRALGYLGIGPVTHKDARLSRDVLMTFAADDWDERVDAVSRGLLGLTVACARCHDHKFDPISTRDYYGLAGIFASTSAVERPLFAIDPATEQRFLWLEQRIHELNYLANLLEKEPGTKPEDSARKVAQFNAELAKLQGEVDALGIRYPELPKQIERYAKIGRVGAARAQTETTPFMNAVYDAALWVNGSDPDLTLLDYKPAEARDLPVFLHGNADTPGEPAPRRFLTVLSHAPDAHFRRGSGRLELAEAIFRDAAPLAARVLVNRVWAWHFGKPLVGTPSDLGAQGEAPSHPGLLDDLSARFIAHGWSLKWLHREIMLSAAYRQSSRPSAAGESADPANRLLWRMNPRRLDVESFRDSILRASGSLNENLYGPSADLDAPENTRRTIYARLSRARLHTIFGLYDLADPSQHSPGRDVTVTPLQQLFVLNSAFVEEQAAALARQVEGAGDDRAKVRDLYRRSLARDPDPAEMDLALSYLREGNMAQLAQALVATNEFIFWP
jgi:cytochrome c553